MPVIKDVILLAAIPADPFYRRDELNFFVMILDINYNFLVGIKL